MFPWLLPYVVTSNLSVPMPGPDETPPSDQNHCSINPNNKSSLSPLDFDAIAVTALPETHPATISADNRQQVGWVPIIKDKFSGEPKALDPVLFSKQDTGSMGLAKYAVAGFAVPQTWRTSPPTVEETPLFPEPTIPPSLPVTTPTWAPTTVPQGPSVPQLPHWQTLPPQTTPSLSPWQTTTVIGLGTSLGTIVYAGLDKELHGMDALPPEVIEWIPYRIDIDDVPDLDGDDSEPLEDDTEEPAEQKPDDPCSPSWGGLTVIASEQAGESESDEPAAPDNDDDDDQKGAQVDDAKPAADDSDNKAKSFTHPTTKAPLHDEDLTLDGLHQLLRDIREFARGRIEHNMRRLEDGDDRGVVAESIEADFAPDGLFEEIDERFLEIVKEVAKRAGLDPIATDHLLSEFEHRVGAASLALRTLQWGLESSSDSLDDLLTHYRGTGLSQPCGSIPALLVRLNRLFDIISVSHTDRTIIFEPSDPTRWDERAVPLRRWDLAEQILEELIHNAFKYGTGEITVSFDPDTDRIIVDSEGPSLGAFDPFERGARHESHGDIQGTGHGLPGMQEAARRNGWDVGYEPQPGRNLFWLDLDPVHSDG